MTVEDICYDKNVCSIDSCVHGSYHATAQSGFESSTGSYHSQTPRLAMAIGGLF